MVLTCGLGYHDSVEKCMRETYNGVRLFGVFVICVYDGKYGTRGRITLMDY